MRSLELLGALVLGAAVMYVLDPDRGRRRRALMRDTMVSWAHKTGDTVEGRSRDVMNRTRGVVAEMRAYVKPRRPRRLQGGRAELV